MHGLMHIKFLQNVGKYLPEYRMSRWGVALTTHSQLVPRLKKGAQLQLYMACSMVKFTE